MTTAATTMAGPVSARVRAWCARAWARRWVRGVVIAAAVLVMLIVAGALWAAVPNLYPPYEPLPGGAPASPEAAARDATRSQAIVTTRASVLAAVAGLGALVTIAINYRNSGLNARTLATTQDTFRVTERAHLTGRYATAIEQVGHDSIAIRLGGIYALQQLAVDTDRDSDQATVVEVLSAFVRLNLHHPTGPTHPSLGAPATTPPPRPERRVAGTGLRRPLPLADSEPSVGARPPRADVLAAISVLAQLPTRNVALRADFTGLDFTRIDLSHARLGHADLRGTHLVGADLTGADLRDVNFYRADLAGADLTRANLIDAELTSANLTGAHLAGANLAGADLTGAHLGLADLYGANLNSTNLTNANLTGANLSHAYLYKANVLAANLTNADLTGAHLNGAHLGRANLRGANLNGAHLGLANLTHADLTGAHLNADLYGVDFTGADLTGASVSEKQLSLTRGRPTRGVDGVAPAAPD